MAGQRRLDIFAAFNEAKAIFFSKTMTTHTVRTSVLELPTLFITENCEKMSQDVALVRPSSCGSGEWWLSFKAYSFRNYRPRIWAVGGGWRDFVLDNGISIGDFLVFELVDVSRLLVHVYDDQLAFKPQVLRRSGEEESKLLNPGSGNVDHKDMDQSHPTKLSSRPVKEYIGFKKTLCASHNPNSKRGTKARLDIPAGFWRSHGYDKFDNKLYSLEGPRVKSYVKASVYQTKTNIRCQFCRGWKTFYKTNKFKVGDTLVFALNGHYQFTVSVET